MTRLVIAVLACAGCVEPDTIVDEVFLDVLLTPGEVECTGTELGAVRSVAVELQQPLGDPESPMGHCVLERECIEVEHESIASLEDLQAALAAHGTYFEGLPEYRDVQIYVWGSDSAEAPCPLSARTPVFCGLSNPADIADPQERPESRFTVATTCAAEAMCPDPWPSCAGTSL